MPRDLELEDRNGFMNGIFVCENGNAEHAATSSSDAPVD